PRPLLRGDDCRSDARHLRSGPLPGIAESLPMSGPSPLLHPPVPTAHAAERWRVLATLMAGRASSRRELSEVLHLRSTSVSDHVGHLVASGLVVESHRPSGGRGRPSGVLIANPHRLAAIV